jgi:membrane fusion protein, heavy metal efflux system
MKHQIALFCLFCLIGWVSGCHSGKSGNENQEQSTGTQPDDLLRMDAAQISANEMELGQPEEIEFNRIITATGFLEALPRNKHTVTIWSGGTIQNLNLIPGDYVKTGQIIFTIQNPQLLQLQEDYLSALELLKFQQDEYNRQQLLASENIAARKVSLKAETDYLSTKAKVEALKTKLRLLKIDMEKPGDGTMVSSISISSPISGYVTRVEGSNGKFVSEQSEIMEIVNTSPMMLNLSVFEKDILKIAEGQTVRFTVPDVSEEVFEGIIEKVGKALEENRTVSVHALFSPPGKLGLLPGMFVKAEIVTETFKALSLPQSALISYDDAWFVLVKSNTEEDHWVLEKKPVIPGYQDGTLVEIMPGSQITPDDKIVIKGAFNVAVF